MLILPLKVGQTFALDGIPIRVVDRKPHRSVRLLLDSGHEVTVTRGVATRIGLALVRLVDTHGARSPWVRLGVTAPEGVGITRVAG